MFKSISGRNKSIKESIKGISPCHCDYLFLGERPGREEHELGYAFVGPSGQIIQSIIDELNITSYWIDNPCPTYHPQNKPPTKGEIALERLAQIIKTISPRYIVLLGNTALISWLMLTSESKKHGSLESYRQKGVINWEGTKVIVTYHPSIIFKKKEIGYRNLIKQDILLSAEYRVKGLTSFKLEPGRIVIDMEWGTKHVLSPQIVDSDDDNISPVLSEGSGLDRLNSDELNTFIQGKKTYLGGVPDINLELGFLEGENYQYQPIWVDGKQVSILSFPKEVTLIGHNIKSDMAHFDDIHDGRVIDTMILEHMIDENSASYSLNNLSRKYFFINLDKSKGENLFDLSFEERKEYNKQDIYITTSLFNILKNNISNKEKIYLLRQGELLKTLSEIEKRGVFINPDKFNHIKSTYIIKLEELVDKFSYNPNSSKQVKEFFKIDNAQAKTLKTVDNTEDLLLFKKIRHYKSMYINKYEELIKDNFIHPEYFPFTLGGRLSCSKPNMQQLPRKDELIPIELNPKEFIHPLPGDKYILVSDLKQAELVMAANLSKDKNMIKGLKSGDLHQQTADYANVKRDWGKNTNFSLLYDGSWFTLSKYDIPKDKAMVLYKAHHELYSGYWEWYYGLRDKLVKDKEIQNIAGKKRHIPLWLDPSFGKLYDHHIKSCMNSMISGPIADLTKDIMVSLHKKHGILTYANVHDGLYFSCNDYEEMIQYIKSSYNPYELWGYKLIVPLKMDFKLGDNFNARGEVRDNR